MTLAELASRLRSYGDGGSTREDLATWFAPLLAADPLDIEESDGEAWRRSPDEMRLFWRLVYLFDTAEVGDEVLRPFARRVCEALDDTRDPALVHELLPIIEDQDRLGTIVDRHARGIISRTGFLSVIAESGYPAHAKLWLEHAGPAALRGLADLLRDARYREAAAAIERAPRD